MGSIIFDLYLQLEYGDEEYSLSEAIADCSNHVMSAALSNLSAVSSYFSDNVQLPIDFNASEEPIDDAQFFIDMSLLTLLPRV